MSGKKAARELVVHVDGAIFCLRNFVLDNINTNMSCTPRFQFRFVPYQMKLAFMLAHFVRVILSLLVFVSTFNLTQKISSFYQKIETIDLWTFTSKFERWHFCSVLFRLNNWFSELWTSYHLIYFTGKWYENLFRK